MFKKFFVVSALLFFSACGGFKPETRPVEPLPMPDEYSMYSEDEPGVGRWWKAFRSDELNALVEEALSGNFNIKTALAKLKQADAVVRQSKANLMPSVNYEGSFVNTDQQTKNRGSAADHSNSQTWRVGPAASYEVDLWGRLDALRQSDILEYRAVQEDLDAAAVTVAAEVADAWVDVLSVRRRIHILKDQIRTNEDLMKLQKLRLANGKADALDVSQQREALASARAILPTLQLSEQQRMNALTILLGRSSAKNLKIEQEELPELIAVPATGLPADLLAARPDVRAAGLRLKAMDLQVSAAKADRFPSLTLSADAAITGGVLEMIFSNWISTLTARLTGPIFDGGKRKAEVDRTRAAAEQFLNEYAQTVAGAIREVEDGLITEKRMNEYIMLLDDQLEASRLTLKNARIQYMNGKDNYLGYLTAWTSVQRLERQLVEERAGIIKNRVNLYRYLGGDWTRNLASAGVENKDI